MSKLKIADNYSLPLEVLTMATAILGLRGSGKTNTAGVWAEELLKQEQQVIVIDPQNVWWGLKSSDDGKSAGYPIVIFGGDHADVPLTGSEGKVVADFVVENRLPCIFSLRHLTLYGQRKFVTEFAEQFFFRKGEAKYQDPCLLIIDEAHKFVPQKVQGDDMAKLVHRIQMLVTEGRASGIGVTLIDQRAATVNKDVLTQIELMVVHRTVGPQDKKALDEWIRDNADEERAAAFRESLAKLPLGRAWFWSPGWLDVFKQVQVRMRQTFDSSKTPKPGERRVEPKRLAEVDLEALKASLAETIKQAERTDPKALQRKVAELTAKITKLESAKPATIKETTTKEVFVLKDNQLVKLEKLIDKIGELAATLDLSKLDIIEAITKTHQMTQLSVPKIEPRQAYTSPTPVKRPERVTVESNGNLAGLHRKIINSLAELESFGVNQPTRNQVSFYLGAVLTRGWGASCVSGLRTTGHIDYPIAGTLTLTDKGRAEADVLDPPRTIQELHSKVKHHLSGLHERILSALLERYPSPISREDLGKQLDNVLERGWGASCVSSLKTAGLIEYPSSGWLRATDLLFPVGLQ